MIKNSIFFSADLYRIFAEADLAVLDSKTEIITVISCAIGNFPGSLILSGIRGIQFKHVGAVDGTACLRRSGNLPAVEFSSAGKENMPADTLVVKIRVPPDRRTMFCEKNIKDRLKSKNIVMLEDKKITKNKIFI